MPEVNISDENMPQAKMSEVIIIPQKSQQYNTISSAAFVSSLIISLNNIRFMQRKIWWDYEPIYSQAEQTSVYVYASNMLSEL